MGTQVSAMLCSLRKKLGPVYLYMCSSEGDNQPSKNKGQRVTLSHKTEVLGRE